MLRELIIAGCGGFAGTAGRYLVRRYTDALWYGAFPLGTFLVNVLGCFLIGLLLGWLEHSKIVSPAANALLVTGFCGGFTTFSTFADDICGLGSKGEWPAMILYLVLSVLIGVLCVLGGRALVR